MKQTANVMRLVVEHWTPRMRNDVAVAAAGASTSEREQLVLVGFALLIWPRLVEAACEAATAELRFSENLAPLKGPYNRGRDFTNRDASMPTFSIDGPEHGECIHVHGNQELRDKIVKLLNEDAAGQ